MKTCYRCPVGRPTRMNRICENCKATLARYGLRWCATGSHAVPERQYLTSRYACIACNAEASRKVWHVARRQPSDPPPGYVRLSEAAPALGYATRTLITHIHLGRIDGWQRAPGGAWYIRMETE